MTKPNSKSGFEKKWQEVGEKYLENVDNIYQTGPSINNFIRKIAEIFYLNGWYDSVKNTHNSIFEEEGDKI
jgi:hypothetical protein